MPGMTVDGGSAGAPRRKAGDAGEAREARTGRWVVAYGPACLGNFAAGFDVLGAALAPAAGGLWGDLVEIRETGEAPGGGTPSRSLVCLGPFAHLLPDDPAQNLAMRACEAFERQLGRALPPLAMRLYKGLPVGSGLGSSSATVVAVLRALEALVGQPAPAAHPSNPTNPANPANPENPESPENPEIDAARLLRAAGEAESHAAGDVHLDNVAPALLGGLRLIDPAGGAPALPFPEELRFVMLSPELTLTTRAARAVLPATVPFAVAVAHGQNLAALVHALYAGDRALLRVCLRDLLAEPYRAALVPGFRAVQAAALKAGAVGCSLSGAGPATFAVVEAAAADEVGEAMRRAWAGAGVASRVTVCGLDEVGARVLEGDDLESVCG